MNYIKDSSRVFIKWYLTDRHYKCMHEYCTISINTYLGMYKTNINNIYNINLTKEVCLSLAILCRHETCLNQLKITFVHLVD